MLGLELWFIYAILSAISGGFYVFITKIGAERNYDGVILNTLASVISAVVLISITFIVSDFQTFSMIAVLLAAANGVLYMVGNVLRFEALKCIDTAIFYPLYKTFSPLLAIFFGVMLLREGLSSIEWLGLAISLSIPLLLISRNEKHRQKDLGRGLRILAVVSVLAAAAAYLLKEAVDRMDDVVFLTAITHVILVAVGLIIALKKQSPKQLKEKASAPRDGSYVTLVVVMGLCHAGSFLGFMAALQLGTLSVVYTIQSLYILIPIVLSIVYYNEHWNTRKVVAIVLSIVALWFLK